MLKLSLISVTGFTKIDLLALLRIYEPVYGLASDERLMIQTENPSSAIVLMMILSTENHLSPGKYNCP